MRVYHLPPEPPAVGQAALARERVRGFPPIARRKRWMGHGHPRQGGEEGLQPHRGMPTSIATGYEMTMYTCALPESGNSKHL